MTQTTMSDQKEQGAAWDKQCMKMQLQYFVVALPPMVLLVSFFGFALQYFVELVNPLISGELAYGRPGYYEYQAAKDQALVILSVLFVLVITALSLSYGWYMRLIRALGPRPGGYSGQSKSWLGAV